MKNVNKFYTESFKQSYDYLNTAPKIFKGADVPPALRYDSMSMAAGYYCHEIANYILKPRVNLPDFIDREVKHYEYELGGSCIYNAVLYICLLVEDRVVHRDFIKMAQGYYKHELRKDFPFDFGKNHIGSHAWTVLNNSVIDFCIIPQEKLFFDFNGEAMLFGNVPEGLELVGYEENFEFVKAYAEKIAEYSNMDYERWILRHKEAAIKVMLEAIEKERRKK